MVTEFDMDALPRALRPDDRDLIRSAAQAGWTVAVEKSGTVVIIAPKPHDRVRHWFRARGKTPNIKRIQRDIMKFGDPAKILAMVERGADFKTPFEPTDEEREQALNELDSQAEVKTMEEAIQELEIPAPKPRAPKKQAKYLVSKRPMLAKGGDGEAYESKVAEERHWSDGVVDYKCVLCDFVSEKRLGVAGHWRKHVTSGEADRTVRPETFEAEVPLAQVYAPRQTRIDALAAALKEAFEGKEIDFTEVAREALMWNHAQTKAGTQFSEGRERDAFTPEELIEQIRILVGGQTHSELERLETVTLDLTARLEATEAAVGNAERDLAEARAERDDARAEVERVRSDLDGLESILQSIRSPRH